jgi:hypothetical protein
MPSLIYNFQSCLGSLFSATKPLASPAHSTGATSQIDHEEAQSVFPNDENLLERGRTQWLCGDCESLTKLARDTLMHYPVRPKIALPAAAGRQQTGQYAKARLYFRRAQDLGLSKKLITHNLACLPTSPIVTFPKTTSQSQHSL